MGVRSIYTTNQDNVMEKCFERYGRKYRSIVCLSDLAESNIDEQLYIKFHGDLNNPDSIIFTDNDYNKRMEDKNNFLNIQLRADLLAKNLLFIGYSLRDINIKKMLEELKQAFSGELPKSFMIVFEYKDYLQKVCDEFGIQLINPLGELPQCANHVEAFNEFLNLLVEKTRNKKVDYELGALFQPVRPGPQKVVSVQEIELLNNSIRNLDFLAYCELLRGIIDSAIIPFDFEEQVANCYIQLASLCSNRKESESLNSAIFNLHLTQDHLKIKVKAAVMATVNQHEEGRGISIVYMTGVSDAVNIVLAAMAIRLVFEWGWKPSDALYSQQSTWLMRAASFNTLSDDLKIFVRTWFDKLWSYMYTTLENPIKRQQRLEAGKDISISPKLMNELSDIIKNY